MAPNTNFKVIIAGAGVAGLALAKMLEMYNVDYLILEAHKDVAPPVGAGIGMLPNGLRILDQIACYEPILKLPQQMLHRTYLRHPNGKPILALNDMSRHYEKRFGIAKDVPGFVVGDQNIVKGRGMSTLLISGPENRVYWFIFVRLPEVLHGAQIPKYTEQDEAEFVKKYSHILVTDKMTFGEIYAAKLTSTFTPLHEYVYSKWFFRRFIVIGDSAHKGLSWGVA
ncbi:FAD-dependent monooxygenase pyr5 [Colletotrichum liriopes]|uniref:FAD-dependent monooxygenase pyr5 n=1 Tax=Colletotrichum liriopes TaxID=708192 RepID=A0AA37LTA2_9PEZI|nr:FAD-dependent monooxygenase pyr5 [Colletotrichum liriopes]